MSECFFGTLIAASFIFGLICFFAGLLWIISGSSLEEKDG